MLLKKIKNYSLQKQLNWTLNSIFIWACPYVNYGSGFRSRFFVAPFLRHKKSSTQTLTRSNITPTQQFLTKKTAIFIAVL
jgi:hypothetical protein